MEALRRLSMVSAVVIVVVFFLARAPYTRAWSDLPVSLKSFPELAIDSFPVRAARIGSAPKYPRVADKQDPFSGTADGYHVFSPALSRNADGAFMVSASRLDRLSVTGSTADPTRIAASSGHPLGDDGQPADQGTGSQFGGNGSSHGTPGSAGSGFGGPQRVGIGGGDTRLRAAVADSSDASAGRESQGRLYASASDGSTPGAGQQSRDLGNNSHQSLMDSGLGGKGAVAAARGGSQAVTHSSDSSSSSKTRAATTTAGTAPGSGASHFDSDKVLQYAGDDPDPSPNTSGSHGDPLLQAGLPGGSSHGDNPSFPNDLRDLGGTTPILDSSVAPDDSDPGWDDYKQITASGPGDNHWNIGVQTPEPRTVILLLSIAVMLAGREFARSRKPGQARTR